MGTADVDIGGPNDWRPDGEVWCSFHVSMDLPPLTTAFARAALRSVWNSADATFRAALVDVYTPLGCGSKVGVLWDACPSLDALLAANHDGVYVAARTRWRQWARYLPD